jgi:hypothetical protein
MNNLLSYFGLTDLRMNASEKDLPVMDQLANFSGQSFAEIQNRNPDGIATRKAADFAKYYVTFCTALIAHSALIGNLQGYKE